jgi:hypothetical protein
MVYDVIMDDDDDSYHPFRERGDTGILRLRYMRRETPPSSAVSCSRGAGTVCLKGWREEFWIRRSECLARRIGRGHCSSICMLMEVWLIMTQDLSFTLKEAIRSDEASCPMQRAATAACTRGGTAERNNAQPPPRKSLGRPLAAALAASESGAPERLSGERAQQA